MEVPFVHPLLELDSACCESFLNCLIEFMKVRIGVRVRVRVRVTSRIIKVHTNRALRALGSC